MPPETFPNQNLILTSQPPLQFQFELNTFVSGGCEI